MKLFDIPNNTAVLTSWYVIHGGLPITEVLHEDDEEGGSFWQFHCGNGDYSMAKMMLVGLGTLLARDETLHEIADLEMGSTARRAARGMPWVIERP